MKPKLIAFPVDDIRCRVWCPFCARWHTHSYDDEERRCWTHRMAHCGNLAKTVFPQGYWIKLAPVKDRRANHAPTHHGPLGTTQRPAVR